MISFFVLLSFLNCAYTLPLADFSPTRPPPPAYQPTFNPLFGAKQNSPPPHQPLSSPLPPPPSLPIPFDPSCLRFDLKDLVGHTTSWGAAKLPLRETCICILSRSHARPMMSPFCHWSHVFSPVLPLWLVSLFWPSTAHEWPSLNIEYFQMWTCINMHVYMSTCKTPGHAESRVQITCCVGIRGSTSAKKTPFA